MADEYQEPMYVINGEGPINPRASSFKPTLYNSLKDSANLQVDHENLSSPDRFDLNHSEKLKANRSNAPQKDTVLQFDSSKNNEFDL